MPTTEMMIAIADKAFGPFNRIRKVLDSRVLTLPAVQPSMHNPNSENYLLLTAVNQKLIQLLITRSLYFHTNSCNSKSPLL